VGQNCFDVVYKFYGVSESELPLVGGLSALHLVFEKTTAENTPFGLNSYLSILSEGGEYCPYQEVTVTQTSASLESGLDSGLSMSSDYAVLSNPFIASLNNDPRFE
jgi:hypothetical protein